MRLEDGREGRLFGGLLTPHGGSTFFDESDSGPRGWGVTFSPAGQPRLRVDKTPGSDEAITLDLTPTERFTGGALTASLGDFGDYLSQVEVMLCRVDGGEAPACSTAVVRFKEGSEELSGGSWGARGRLLGAFGGSGGVLRDPRGVLGSS